MKSHFAKKALVAAIVLVASSAVFADAAADATSSTAPTTAPVAATDATGPYVGLMAGNDMSGLVQVDDGSARGVLLGWRFDSGISLEAVVANTEHDTILAGCGIESDTVGVYGAIRSKKAVYVKARAGVLSEDLSSTGVCMASATSSDTGLSLGFGGGVRFGKGALEAEYTLIETDISRLSLTLLMNF